MKPFLLLAITAIVGLSNASILPVPVGVTVGLTEYSHPIKSLYHSQDAYGQYVYGYSTPAITRSETKSADGVTQGGYSYIDADGILQTVQYTADAIHGFRVAASNLPKDNPDVAYAKAQHLAQFNQIAAERTVKYTNPIAVPIGQVPQVNVLPQPVQDLPEVAKARAEHLAILQAAYQNQVVPHPVQDLPEVAKAKAEHLALVNEIRARDYSRNFISPVPADFQGPSIPIHTSVSSYSITAPTQHVSYTPAILHEPASSQYHAQDGLGQYSYGYVGPLSSKSETKSADGVTRGGYSYIDANGVLQTVSYIADAVNGFRVAATNLPKAPKTKVIAPAEPVVVQKSAHAGHVESEGIVPAVAPQISGGDGALYTQEVWY